MTAVDQAQLRRCRLIIEQLVCECEDLSGSARHQAQDDLRELLHDAHGFRDRFMRRVLGRWERKKEEA